MDVFCNHINIFVHITMDSCDILIFDKFPIVIIASGRKCTHLVHPADQVLCLTGKCNLSALGITIKQRTNSDLVTGCDQLAAFVIVQYAGIFRIQMGKHFQSIFFI